MDATTENQMKIAQAWIKEMQAQGMGPVVFLFAKVHPDAQSGEPVFENIQVLMHPFINTVEDLELIFTRMIEGLRAPGSRLVAHKLEP